MWIVIILSILLGLAMAIVGLHGRRTDDHPLCRRCWFDLTGRASDSTRCPECGADLTRRRATVVGHRRRRPVLAAGGLVLLASAITVEAEAVRRWSTTDFWYPCVPTPVLVHEAGLADPARHEPAMGELLKRYDAGGWSAWTCRAAADAALACQRDPATPWDARWGDLLERLRADGRLSDDRWATYAAQAGLVLTLYVRPVVRHGDPLPFECELRFRRVAGRTRLWWDFQQRTAVCTITGADGGAAVPAHAHRGRVDAADLAPLRPDGSARTLTWGADVAVGEGDSKSGYHTLVTRHLTASGPFTLVPADRSSVTAVPDPASADAVRRSLTVSARWDGEPRRGVAPGVVLDVDSERMSLDLSFAVTARCDGHEYPVDTLLSRHGYGGLRTHFRCPPALGHPRTVDVIFRTDPSLAATTTVDVTTVWAGEVMFAGVAVE